MAAASPGDSSHHLLDLQGEDAALGPSVPDVSGGEALAVDTAPPPMWTRDWLHFAKAELTWLLRLAAPMSGTFLLNNISYIVMLLFVGRLGKSELAAAGLGFSVFNLIAYSFGLGLCCALDTFCSQAYGAGAYHRLGIYLQRGIVVFTAYIILLLPLMFNSYSILVALGQEPRIAELASFVCKIMAVSLWPLLLYECLKKFFSAQGISSPLLIASVLYISTVTLGLYVTIVVMDLGFAGAPLTMATANALVPLYLLVQAHYWHPTAMQQTWRGWTWECMRGWGEYLRMGIPAAILLCTEWWAFEILIMLSGVLGVAQLAASQVHLSVLNFIYMFPLGLSIAANTRVGNLLGAGEPYHARGVVYVTLMFTWGMMLGICFGLLALRNQLGKFFSTDASVVHLIAAILPIASFTVVLDGNQAVCQGVLRAAGLQKLGAILNFCSYYVICIPLAVVMAFVFKWDVWGLWISIAVAEVTVVILFWWAIWMVDWKEQSKLAQSRSSVDDVSLGHH